MGKLQDNSAISYVVAGEWNPFSNENRITSVVKNRSRGTWAEENPENNQSLLRGASWQHVAGIENDIGHVEVFLSSEDSDYITGQTMMVDGGSIKLR